MKRFIFLLIFASYSLDYSAQFTLVPTGTTSQLNKISILNNNIVINGRSNYIVKSYNECNTFTPLTVAGQVGYSNYLQRIDTNKLYILSVNSGSNKIYKSVDGGNNWVEKYDTTMLITHFRFFDSLEGIAVAPTYKLKRTKNGGNTWSSGSSPASITTAIEVFGDSMICLGDGSGTIYLSKNRGKTWPLGWGFPGTAYPRDIYFVNEDTIFVISAPSTSGLCYFTKTLTGGQAWQNSTTIPLNNPYSIYFKNSKEGYIVGRDNTDNYGTILKTINGGQSWLEYKTQYQTIFIDINFINDSIAFITGTGGELLKWNAKQTQFVGLKENLNSNARVSVYPNPASDILNIEFLDAEGSLYSKLQIINSLGQAVKEEEIYLENGKAKINVRQLTSGIYTARFTGNNNYALKFIKE